MKRLFYIVIEIVSMKMVLSLLINVFNCLRTGVQAAKMANDIFLKDKKETGGNWWIRYDDQGRRIKDDSTNSFYQERIKRLENMDIPDHVEQETKSTKSNEGDKKK